MYDLISLYWCSYVIITVLGNNETDQSLSGLLIALAKRLANAIESYYKQTDMSDLNLRGVFSYWIN